jgi:hypothetical protein
MPVFSASLQESAHLKETVRKSPEVKGDTVSFKKPQFGVTQEAGGLCDGLFRKN